VKHIALTVNLFVLFLPLVLRSQTVTFSLQPYPVGMTTNNTDKIEGRLELLVSEACSGVASMNTREILRYTVTVLASTPDFSHRCSVFVEEASENKSPSFGTATLHQVEGNTYFVEHSVDSMFISRQDGNVVSKDERETLMRMMKRDYDQTLKHSLNGRTLAVGDTLEITDELRTRFLELMDEKDLNADDFQIILSAFDEVQSRECAMFDLRIRLNGVARGMDTDVTLHGGIILSVNELWLLSLFMSGSIAGTSVVEEQPMLMEGSIVFEKLIEYP